MDKTQLKNQKVVASSDDGERHLLCHQSVDVPIEGRTPGFFVNQETDEIVPVDDIRKHLKQGYWYAPKSQDVAKALAL